MSRKEELQGRDEVAPAPTVVLEDVYVALDPPQYA
jgi:hypothetical protein